MSSFNGGYYDYDPRSAKNIFFRATKTETDTVTVKSGQVLKALSFVQTDNDGKVIAHTGIAESALVTFNATLASAGTVTVGSGGIVFTAGSAGATPAQLVTAVSVLVGGDSAANANIALLAAGIPTTVGTFTSGTAPAFNFNKYDANTAVANSTSILTNVTDLAVTSTGTAPTVAKIDGATALPKTAGVLMYDVDASAGDVKAEVFKRASFWAYALTWAVDTADLMTRADGSTIAYTAYNTGASGTSAAAILRQKKFVEGTNFEPLGFLTAGEIANG
jgi:hypothetical protein